MTLHMESPEIKAKLLVEQCIAIYINRSTSCIACNKVQPVNNEEEFVTCKNCKMTTLASIFQTKLVSQVFIIYGFKGHYLKMRDVCADFEPCSKCYSFVSFHSKVIKLGQN